MGELKQMVICLRMDGYYIDEVMKITGLARQTIVQYSQGYNFVKRKQFSNGDEITRLHKMGYASTEIANRLKCHIKTVLYHLKNNQLKSNIMPKKKTKATPTQMEQRDVLGKGIEPGVYTREVKLRDDRDSGRMLNLLYSDLSDKPTVQISIRVKDDVSDQEAADRWGKKFGKKSWKLS